MAFDGSSVCALCHELNNRLSDGRISRIIQPEQDELLITVKVPGDSLLLRISVNPSLPAAYITEEKNQAPLNAPSFCMLLRKHLQGGRIVSVTQPSLERIINIQIEHRNEMGDLCEKILTIELMGKHSNIIFRDGNRILDSIRHVSALVSSVREVLPGREYFIPFEGDKLDPLSCSEDDFYEKIFSGSDEIYRSMYSGLTGLSPELSEEIVYNAGIDGNRPSESLSASEKASLYGSFKDFVSIMENKAFIPCIVYNDGAPKTFTPFEFNIYTDLDYIHFDSMSELLYTYYSSRQLYTGLRQKTSDLRQIVQTLISKNAKKYDLQLKQIKDTEKKDRYKVYGELLTAYGYSVPAKSTSFTCENFYNGEEVAIPLDPSLSAIENGKKYFEKYSKLKRTFESLSTVIEETKADLEHLESILVSLDSVKNEADIADIRREMIVSGYIKNKQGGKKKKGEKATKSEPLHFVSSDGFHIYVGKNNFQNEYITFSLADGNDWWFHAKKIPGSHVIIKCEGKEPSDTAFNEAASLAAHFSKAGNAARAEVDYVQKKHVKKTPGGRPGFVIYHTNYSMPAPTDISNITEIK